MSEPIAAEAVRDVTEINDVAVSPDGKTVAIVTSEYDGEEDEAYSSIQTVPADGSEPPHRLTRVASASSPKWSPDGETLAFLAAREEDIDRRIGRDDESKDDEEANGNGNDDEPETQVWAFDMGRGGDARQLTDREYGVSEFDWGPDGERIVIAARDPTEEQAEYLERRESGGPIEIERLQHKADGVGYLDDVTTYLFVVDIETGEETRLDEAYGAGAIEPSTGLHPAWHPTDDVIAYITCGEERPDDSTVTNVYTVDVESGERTQLTDEGYLLVEPDWSPDGSRLVTNGPPADNWYHPGDVFVINRETGEVTSLTDDFESRIADTAAPRFVTETTMLVPVGHRGHRGLYRLDVDDDEPSEIPDIVTQDQSIRHFDAGADTLAVTIESPDDGHDVYTMAGLRDTPTRVTEFNKEFLANHSLPGVTRIETETASEPVESLLFYPDSFDPADPDPHPTLVWSHGGPMSFDYPKFRFGLAYFVSRGYVICKPNYRGSTSYGTDFAEALRGQWGSVEVEDVLAVTDDIVERNIADEDRLFACGFSYGGIMTGYLVTRSDRYTAAAAEHGVYDLQSLFGTADTQAWTGQEFGLPWESSDIYEANSSITDIGGVQTPTLITAGGQDWRCPPTQSEQFYVSLRKQDVPAKLVVYPEEHHDIGKPERAIHRLETLAEWFERHDPTVDASD